MATICFDVSTQENNFGTSKLEVLFEFTDWAPNLSLWVLYHHEPCSWRVLYHPWAAVRCPLPPARDSRAPMAMVSKAQEVVLGLQHGNPVMGPAGPESLGLVQLSKLKSLWLNWRTSKQSLIYFFSFPLTTGTNTPRLTFFYIKFLLSFPEKPLTAPLYCSWGSKEQVHRAEGREPGRTHDSRCMVPAWPGPPCWHWLGGC